MAHFDVLIIGGGIAGASLGTRLAGRLSVAILEAEAHCALHATGRSAAFWLAHYGGPQIIPLSMASRPLLNAGWPLHGESLLRGRGALVVAKDQMDLRDALSAETSKAPRRETIGRSRMEALLPGLRGGWDHGLLDPTCADIDVARLHQDCLALFRRSGGTLICNAALESARRSAHGWAVCSRAGDFTAGTIVDAAGAWCDVVAERCGVAPLGIRPYRRTVVQLRIGRRGLADLPLVLDAFGRFYFKGESDNRVWVSPHDETLSAPCDAAPEEIDVATAIDHFQSVVDWPVEAVERKWAGLRSFTPRRVPAVGADPEVPGFFWCAGQGGFGIQTAPALSALAAALLLGDQPPEFLAQVDPAPYRPRS